MLRLPHKEDSIIESYDFAKILEEQEESMQRIANLPYYLRMFQKKKEDFIMQYLRTRNKAFLISHYKLNQIYEGEIARVTDEGIMPEEDSLSDVLRKLDRDIAVSQLLYKVTFMNIFWDMYVALFYVKEAVFSLRQIKRDEDAMMRVID